MGSIGSYTEPTKPKVYILDPYHDDVIALLTTRTDIQCVLPYSYERHQWTRDATAVLVRSETRIGREELENAAPLLRYIIKQGVGVDNIDLDAARDRGVRVYNTPGLNSEAVAELTLALALCIARRVCEIDGMTRNGLKVVRSQCLGQSLYRKVIGIVGMGHIGLEVAKKWVAAMDGHVIAYDPYAKDDAWVNSLPESRFDRCVSLEDLLRTADVLSLHVPLTTTTRNLISTTQFELMKSSSILLNCARGGIVDEDALLNALQTDKLFGAGLDAMQYEPPTKASYGDTLLAHPRVVMTPHIGASTYENQLNSGIAVANILFDLLEGRAGPPCLSA